MGKSLMDIDVSELETRRNELAEKLVEEIQMYDVGGWEYSCIPETISFGSDLKRFRHEFRYSKEESNKTVIVGALCSIQQVERIEQHPKDVRDDGLETYVRITKGPENLYLNGILNDVKTSVCDATVLFFQLINKRTDHQKLQERKRKTDQKVTTLKKQISELEMVLE